MLIALAILAVILAIKSLTDWRWALKVFVLYMPVCGVPVLLSGSEPFAILFKDIALVIPLYLSLFLFNPSELLRLRLPLPALPIMAAFGAWVLLQSANPASAGPLVALVGIKVWLLYMPLTLVVMASLREEKDLVVLMRIMLLPLPLVAGVGLVQYFGSLRYGQEATLTAFYGDAARIASQGFTQFNYGGTYGGTIYRLPATFVSVAHYFGYLAHALVPAYILHRIDPSRGWRVFARLVLPVLYVSAFLSGSRSAFLFMPAFTVAILMFDKVLLGGFLWLGVLIVGFVVAMSASGIDTLFLFERLSTLSDAYANDLVVGSVVEAIERFPMGSGTGMNTGGARYVLPAGLGTGFESEYAKAVVELGIPGLILFLAAIVAVWLTSLANLVKLGQSPLRSAAGALAGYLTVMPIYIAKGCQLDLEPSNAFYWIFSGMAFALPALVRPTDTAGLQRPAALRQLHDAAKLSRRPGLLIGAAEPRQP